MVSLETELKPQSQTSFPSLDCLYCEEKCWDDTDKEEQDNDGVKTTSTSSSQLYAIDDDDDEQFVALLSKEGKALLSECVLDAVASMPLMQARREVFDWMKMVNAHHSFSANTMVLSVNYFDRFMMRFGYQSDRPWMTQLAAVACLSLASKIEETYVPLLLDFQVDCKYIFEAKTIKRMELLVLCTLEWKMNAVTPLSYFEHLIKRLNLKTHLQWEILCRFETLILFAVADPRYLCHVPSVIAAATMVQTLKELGLGTTLEHQIHHVDIFKLSKDKVEECCKFIQELSSNNNSHKRKDSNTAQSPRNVLDVVFSESSKDSSISLQPSPKRSRTLESHFSR